MSEKKESKFLRFAYYAIPILLAVYVLSIGPVAAFLVDSDGSMIHPEYAKEFSYFYYPLMLLITQNKLARDAYFSYLNLCNDSNISIE